MTDTIPFRKYTMNHGRMMLTITAIVAAAALATIAFAIPEQVMAGGYRHHHNNHHNNGIKVDQQINQENRCTDSICANDGQNNFGPPQLQVVWK